MYKVGVVYIWHNQTGIYACLNGVETTVLSGPLRSTHPLHPVYWDTDTLLPGRMDTPGNYLCAFPGDLKEKKPPSNNTGELRILELFKQSELEPA